MRRRLLNFCSVVSLLLLMLAAGVGIRLANRPPDRPKIDPAASAYVVSINDPASRPVYLPEALRRRTIQALLAPGEVRRDFENIPWAPYGYLFVGGERFAIAGPRGVRWDSGRGTTIFWQGAVFTEVWPLLGQPLPLLPPTTAPVADDGIDRSEGR